MLELEQESLVGFLKHKFRNVVVMKDLTCVNRPWCGFEDILELAAPRILWGQYWTVSLCRPVMWERGLQSHLSST